MSNTTARFTVKLGFNSQRDLQKFLNVHLPFSCEIEDHGEPKTIRRRGKASAKPTAPARPAARPSIPTD